MFAVDARIKSSLMQRMKQSCKTASQSVFLQVYRINANNRTAMPNPINTNEIIEAASVLVN